MVNLEALLSKQDWLYSPDYLAALKESRPAVRSLDRFELQNGQEKESRRLPSVLRRKEALRIELRDMLDAIPLPAVSIPNPVRVELREQLPRLEEEISSLNCGFLRVEHSRREGRLAHRGAVEKPVTAAASAAKKLENPARDRILTVAEARKWLGVSRSTIYRWLEEGRLKRPSLGREPGKRGKALILKSSLEKLLQEDSK